jgi:hypothetical protein
VFVVTGALLTGLALNMAFSGLDSMKIVAATFSTACAAVAAITMLIDAADLWVRGRRMTPYSVKMFRSLVFIAVLGAVAGSLMGGNVLVIFFLAPSMVVYLFVARRPPAPAPRARGGSGASSGSGGSGGAASGGSGSAARARQRRGGKKRR